MKQKQINPLTNKQTNKPIFLDPKYLNNMKLDLQKTFRETSCGFPIMHKTNKQNKTKQTNP